MCMARVCGCPQRPNEDVEPPWSVTGGCEPLNTGPDPVQQALYPLSSYSASHWLLSETGSHYVVLAVPEFIM